MLHRVEEGLEVWIGGDTLSACHCLSQIHVFLLLGYIVEEISRVSRLVIITCHQRNCEQDILPMTGKNSCDI